MSLTIEILGLGSLFLLYGIFDENRKEHYWRDVRCGLCQSRID
jgi:hypothetical protein